MESFINVPIRKLQPHDSKYRVECMNGASHPMGIEMMTYELVHIGTKHIDATERVGHHSQFNENELDLIREHSLLPEMEWAIDNSFDGLYVDRQPDNAHWRTVYRFAVYLKGDHATFWRVKYS